MAELCALVAGNPVILIRNIARSLRAFLLLAENQRSAALPAPTLQSGQTPLFTFSTRTSGAVIHAAFAEGGFLFVLRFCQHRANIRHVGLTFMHALFGTDHFAFLLPNQIVLR